jgi:hypothetical protein
MEYWSVGVKGIFKEARQSEDGSVANIKCQIDFPSAIERPEKGRIWFSHR